MKGFRIAAVLALCGVLWLGSGVAMAVTVFWREYPPNTSPEGANLDDSLAGGTDILGVRVKSGSVTFTGNNTYTGGTEVTGGTFLANSASPLGSGPVTVSNGAYLQLNGQTITNTVTLNDGGHLYNFDIDSATNGNILLQSGGTCYIETGSWSNKTLTLNQSAGTISGDANLIVRATYRGATFKFYGNNSYTGTTTITKTSNGGSTAYAYNANAFGTTANTIVVNGTSGYAQQATLVLTSNLPAGGLNANKSIEIGQYGFLTLERGTTISNTVTLKGGTYTFSGTGAGNRTHNGTIILATGTTSSVYRGRYSYGEWYQTGLITGDGALSTDGYNGADTRLHFNGSNDYTGGTLLRTNGYGTAAGVYVGSNTGFGTGPVTLSTVAGYRTALVLEGDVTMANEFRGMGTISRNGASNYTLTTTGAISPGSSLETITIEKLKFGSDAVGCTYNWEYDGTSSDLIDCPTSLAFGSATEKLNVIWKGAGDPLAGTFTLMTYAGTDPVLPSWDLTTPVGPTGPLLGSVWLDDAKNQVMLTLQTPLVPEPAPLALLLLGVPALLRRRRA